MPAIVTLRSGVMRFCSKKGGAGNVVCDGHDHCFFKKFFPAENESFWMKIILFPFQRFDISKKFFKKNNITPITSPKKIWA